VAKKPGVDQLIVLPARGLRAAALHPEALVAAAFGPVEGLRVLDSIADEGAKLVEVSGDARRWLRLSQPGLRVLPMRLYRPAVVGQRRARLQTAAVKATAAVKLKLRVVSRADGSPVAGATVVAFSDFESGLGAQGKSNAGGDVTLSWLASTTTIERLYVYPRRDFWGLLKRDLRVSSRLEVPLLPIDLAGEDGVRHFFPEASAGAGAGVTVGVIDTGIDTAHPDLRVEGGRNCVPGESPDDFGDNGESHGTHVAGIIAGRGKAPSGTPGLAPEVDLRSYRVFGKNSEEASNYAILKAIDAALEEGCDLINMSLGGGGADDALRTAVEEAHARGSLVIVAAGNDEHGPVSFPASDDMVLAVSAMGRKGTFPNDTPEADFVAPPYGKDKKNFFAAFSNLGPEIDLVGPGVGIVSSVPGGYAAMSGTSMACPAVTGAAARLLSRRPELLAMKRDQERAVAFARALLGSAQMLGFGAEYEGQGLPRVG
jgi:subtilisin